MKNPYQKRLEQIKASSDDERDVVIHRHGASELKGKLHSINDDGCEVSIKEATLSPDSMLVVFVAYEDIRGIGVTEWSM